MNKIILEWDDLHPNRDVDCLVIAEKLIETVPNIVMNFFVPAQYGGEALYTNREWCGRLRSMIESGNVNVGVHGLLHSTLEFAHKSYQDAVSSIKAAEAIFNAAGLPYQKVFRGPQWGISAPTIEALIDLGYTHLYSHADKEHVHGQFADKIKIVKYNFNFKDEWPAMENPVVGDTVVCHGHTSGLSYLSCGNSIWNHQQKIIDLAKSGMEMLSVSDY